MARSRSRSSRRERRVERERRERAAERGLPELRREPVRHSAPSPAALTAEAAETGRHSAPPKAGVPGWLKLLLLIALVLTAVWVLSQFR